MQQIFFKYNCMIVRRAADTQIRIDFVNFLFIALC